ncbi:MAG: dihydroorotate dehydrogenase electron transfer subunit [Syntrophobacteraceae bacterium]
MAKFKINAQVLGQKLVAAMTWRLRLKAPKIAHAARPGQFVMLQVREGTDPLLRRPFSFHGIHSSEGDIEILYRVVGRGTWLLSQLEPGATVSLVGPLGNAFDTESADAGDAAIVAGGIGIAPLLPLIDGLLASGTGPGDRATVHLFYGARSGPELLPADSFDRDGLRVHWSTDDGSFGHRGFVTQLLADAVDRGEIDPVVVYGCGPLPMQYHVAKWALARNIRTQLSLESLMACGFGACLGCALPAVHPRDPHADHYVHVCKDGPIFQAGIIQWNRIRLHPAAPPTYPCS